MAKFTMIPYNLQIPESKALFFHIPKCTQLSSLDAQHHLSSQMSLTDQSLRSQGKPQVRRPSGNHQNITVRHSGKDPSPVDARASSERSGSQIVTSSKASTRDYLLSTKGKKVPFTTERAGGHHSNPMIKFSTISNVVPSDMTQWEV